MLGKQWDVFKTISCMWTTYMLLLFFLFSISVLFLFSEFTSLRYLAKDILTLFCFVFYALLAYFRVFLICYTIYNKYILLVAIVYTGVQNVWDASIFVAVLLREVCIIGKKEMPWYWWCMIVCCELFYVLLCLKRFIVFVVFLYFFCNCVLLSKTFCVSIWVTIHKVC